MISSKDLKESSVDQLRIMEANYSEELEKHKADLEKIRKHMTDNCIPTFKDLAQKMINKCYKFKKDFEGCFKVVKDKEDGTIMAILARPNMVTLERYSLTNKEKRYLFSTLLPEDSYDPISDEQFNQYASKIFYKLMYNPEEL